MALNVIDGFECKGGTIALKLKKESKRFIENIFIVLP